MKKILLMGNPNVGKSVIFSRLTGLNVIASNYAGTTVSFSKGYIKYKEKEMELIDVPGTYTLHPTNEAEMVAVKMLKTGDIVVNVIDATNLERNLFLTLQLITFKKPMILVLNMWDETKHKGIDIDVEKLQAILGIPVITTCGISGEGIKEIVDNIENATISSFVKESFNEVDNSFIWNKIGEIIPKVQRLYHHHHTKFCSD